MSRPSQLHERSVRTIAAYEAYADEYTRKYGNSTSPESGAVLRRVAGEAGVGGHVLEVGSGPGSDADFLETLGVTVRRTDATQRFVDLQVARGKAAELLNIITDEMGGPYDAVVALCVLIHVPRHQVGHVLERISGALRPKGVLLVSMRDGEGESVGAYHTVYWQREAFVSRLEAAGLIVEWDEFHVDNGNDAWNTFLARKPA